ncbi:MAG TPA: TauD/TfdA family dioxygenase [Burkholderiales bacterium]|nr:TauD/TfdA family dioxygenase [Burkholderiales bacterium]
MRIKKSAAPIGAEIFDIDLSKGLDDSTYEAAANALHENEVVVFRGQKLTAPQQIAFSRRFGDLDVNVRSEFNKDGHPEVLVLSNIQKDGKPIGVVDAGRYWHTDLCYLKRPARATVLHALEVPMNGDEPLGDTLFSSMTCAYEALPEATKRRVEGLKAVHSYRYTYEQKARDFKLRPNLVERGTDWLPPDVVHDVVRRHPVTGKKCLYVNEGYTTRIVGLPKAESDALLAELKAHAVQPQFQYTHKWQVGDLLMWDNCAVQHKAVPNYALPQRRLIERTTVLGPAEIGVLASAVESA